MKKIITILLFLNIFYSLNANSTVVFMYHRFGENKYPSTNIHMHQFQKHIKYIEENKFNVWPLSKIINHLQNKKIIPEKTIAITMDDAYKSVYTKAYPLLKEKNYPFTVFVNTSAIRNNSKVYMSWDEMREMSSNGAEFANHSLTHDYMKEKKDENTLQWQNRIKNEVEGAQIKLQKELGKDTNTNPKLFSYPYGEYTSKTAQYIKSLGYTGIAQTSGPIDEDTNLLALPRFAMAESFGCLNGFKLKANTLVLPIKSISNDEPLINETNNPPTLTITLKEPIKGLKCFTSNGQEINIKFDSDLKFQIKSNKPLRKPRDRYTCTAPAKDGKWYWYSHLWIVDGKK